MTRQEFISKYTHQVSGPVLDVLFRNAAGGELSLLVRRMMQQMDSALGAAYDELTREKARESAPAAVAAVPRPARVANTNGSHT